MNYKPKQVDIIIKQIEERDGEYMAYVPSAMLEATYALYFKDTLFGAVALNNFSGMIRYQYETAKVNFIISGERFRFQNPGLLDVLKGKKEAFHGHC
jgi:hypothetical protein